MIALALALAQPAAKLVIIPPGQPATLVDYPTLARCEHARAVFLKSAEDAKARAQQEADKLGRPIIVKTVSAYCLPS